MNETFATSLPIAQSLICLLFVVAFWWPAWRWLAVLNHGQEQALSQRMAMAFVIAFGAFSLCTGPMLLLHMSSQVAMTIICVIWILASISAEIAWRKKLPAAPNVAEESRTSSDVQLAHSTRTFLPAFLFSLAAATSLALGWLPSQVALSLVVLSFLCNLWLSRAPSARPIAIPTKANPAVRLAFFALLALALVSPTFHHRADADDNLYLSEALILQDSPAMGAIAPTHRGEALPANPVYAWQSFELWGAMLARFSGLHPLIVMRSLLGPILLLLSLSLYATLLRRMIPPRLLQVGMVFLLAYFLFGISSHWTPNNYLLTRPQQGKTWLMHAGVLALFIQGLAFLKHTNKSNAFLLFLISCACLGWAPTAILLVPAALGTLGLAQLFLKPSIQTIKQGLWLGLCLTPQIFFLLFLRMQEENGMQEATLNDGAPKTWSDLFFFTFLKMRSGGGALELLALSAAPLLILFYPKNRRQAYPLVFLGILAALLLNPFLFGWVSDMAAGKWGYMRLFWLLPFPLLIGALGANLYASFLKTKGALASGIVMLGLLAALPLSGAHYVWSRKNLYSESDKGVVLYPVENPYKIPQDLLDLAEELQGLPLGPEHRVLAHLNEVTHLAPLVKRFDFVFARDFQTPPPLLALGRVEEAQRREELGLSFLSGQMTNMEAAPLLELEQASYIIVSPSTADLSDSLAVLDYSLRFGSGPYELWVRD